MCQYGDSFSLVIPGDGAKLAVVNAKLPRIEIIGDDIDSGGIAYQNKFIRDMFGPEV